MRVERDMQDKFVCHWEGCDQPHCSRCGHHYDPQEAEGRNVCAHCQIQAASDECEAVTRPNNERRRIYL